MTCSWSRSNSDSRDSDHVSVIWMKRKESEVGVQGDMAIHVPSVHFGGIDEVVPDHPVSLSQ